MRLDCLSTSFFVVDAVLQFLYYKLHICVYVILRVFLCMCLFILCLCFVGIKKDKRRDAIAQCEYKKKSTTDRPSMLKRSTTLKVM